VTTSVDIRAPVPHVFILSIDSLRRDYLSPYNPAVTFTPGVAKLAADSYVFRNAFTAYGGTWMSLPAMWTGTPLTRGWGQIFKQINAIEPLIKSGDYDLLINDFTIDPQLTTPRTFLNRGVPSVQTDLCENLKAVKAHIDTRATQERPVFTFLAPMNVHILNTRTGSGGPVDPRYAGFHAPYAARLERIDACLESFITYLQDRGWYDNSIIILTADHGESLGADGNWGHQLFLFPEDVRIPLIVRLPPAMRERFTTDLARLTLLPDMAPTLLALLGQPVPDLGPPFGAPAFVPPDAEPRPRRRESFLLMSSYGSTFALLRRNGKFLYISDLVNWREYAYTLFREPLGERVPITETLRRAGQADILRKMDEVDALFRAK
jgi:arylsulfatase A-like enzyme